MKTKIIALASAVFVAIAALLSMGAITTGPITTGTVTNVLNGVYIAANNGQGTNTTFVGPDTMIKFSNTTATATHQNYRLQAQNSSDSFGMFSYTDGGLVNATFWTAPWDGSRFLIAPRLEVVTGITNTGWYNGTGLFTNRSDAWLGFGDNDISIYLDTANAGTSRGAIKWTRSGTAEKWILGNDEGGASETLTLQNQTGANVMTAYTNGTLRANNIFEVGSYSYTVSTNLTTPSNTPTLMASFAVPTDKAITIYATVTASQSSSANGGGYVIVASGSNNGGTTAIISTQTILSEKESIAGTVAITFDNTTDTGQVTVTGVAGTEVKWGGKFDVIISE